MIYDDANEKVLNSLEADESAISRNIPGTEGQAQLVAQRIVETLATRWNNRSVLDALALRNQLLSVMQKDNLSREDALHRLGDVPGDIFTLKGEQVQIHQILLYSDRSARRNPLLLNGGEVTVRLQQVKDNVEFYHVAIRVSSGKGGRSYIMGTGEKLEFSGLDSNETITVSIDDAGDLVVDRY